jgi:hypothetical protein
MDVIAINTLDFYEINSNGEPTGICHPDPLKLRQETTNPTGINIHNIYYDPLVA